MTQLSAPTPLRLLATATRAATASVEQAAGKRRELARRLNWAYQQKNLGKTERCSIANLVCELSGALVGENDDDDMPF